MERDPEDRYRYASQMKSELDCPERVLTTGRAERAKPPSPWKVRWRRMRLVVWAVAATLVAIGAFFLFCRMSGSGT